MKTVGLITEYNPFHNGHKHHIAQAKKQTGADAAVVVMSGNFVQRGMPAFVDKYTRTRIALQHGADLVIELPTIFATASAEGFAKGAVSILHQMGMVDSLCFGMEEPDISALTLVASILTKEPDAFSSRLKSLLKDGLSFPVARQQALQQYCRQEGIKISDSLLSSPNNLLGLEYVKALQQLNSHIKPFSIQRIHAGYHDSNEAHCYYSATALRKLNEEQLLKTLTSIDNIYTESYLSQYPVKPEDFDALLGEKLYQAVETHSLTEYLDVTPDLANAITNALYSYTGFEAFIETLKNKSLTYTRISRVLIHILVGIKKDLFEDMMHTDSYLYLRVLGFNETGRKLLKKIPASLSLIVKTAGYEKQIPDSKQKEMLELNLAADRIYRMATMTKYKHLIPNEFTQKVISCINS